MKSTRRTVTTAAALAALALSGTLAATAPASAATPTQYNGACGAGYDVIRATPIRSSQSTVAATTFVTFNSIAGKVCAVTVRTTPGARVFMEVTLDTWPYSSGEAREAGSFTSYAGPVYKDVPDDGQCLTWSGSIDVYYNSENGNCT
ncbi:hypothetical protein ACGFSG_25710 [Streptomyces sp. NPDC048512]|uniref:hypothetical protein n=1 Tax=unclassified Streptomyces TaxID=2593676 RepID=UPI0009BE4C64|nr:hypothetical protein [Streptomyces sp. M41(2017)]OQQ13819.1 hypothetical protein B0675_26680 [Streptomyces sp. M41(2017)]